MLCLLLAVVYGASPKFVNLLPQWLKVRRIPILSEEEIQIPKLHKLIGKCKISFQTLPDKNYVNMLLLLHAIMYGGLLSTSAADCNRDLNYCTSEILNSFKKQAFENDREEVLYNRFCSTIVDVFTTCTKDIIKRCAKNDTENMNAVSNLVRVLKQLCTDGSRLNKKMVLNAECLYEKKPELLSCVAVIDNNDIKSVCRYLEASISCFYKNSQKFCGNGARSVFAAVGKPFKAIAIRTCKYHEEIETEESKEVHRSTVIKNRSAGKADVRSHVSLNHIIFFGMFSYFYSLIL